MQVHLTCFCKMKVIHLNRKIYIEGQKNKKIIYSMLKCTLINWAPLCYALSMTTKWWKKTEIKFHLNENIECNLNWIKFKLNWFPISLNSNSTSGLIFNYAASKFNCKKMECKLLEKLLKIFSWIWCWKKIN
jgi:hypothetical protein